MATLTIPTAAPSADDDADQLRKAFQGWGTNEALIISILAHRNAAQRRAIRAAYAAKYSQELLKSLDDEIGGDFERAVIMWSLDPAERDAALAGDAVRRWSPAKGRVLVEIACARGSLELLAARQAYHTKFKRSLEEDVASHTSGDYRKLLVTLVSSYRYEGPDLNMKQAKAEARVLHDKIAGKAYADDDLIRVLSTRSKPQLIATFNCYNNDFGHPVNKDLKADPKDEFLATLRAVVRCVSCPEKYLEKVVRRAIAGLGTDEDSLTRVITTRAEVDLKLIKEAYEKRNSVPLERAVAGDTSGDYERFLLALLGAGTAAA